jgi:hypothetical protein
MKSESASRVLHSAFLCCLGAVTLDFTPLAGGGPRRGRRSSNKHAIED